MKQRSSPEADICDIQSSRCGRMSHIVRFAVWIHELPAMPLDHYVSQVHLRKFHSPDQGGLLYAVRKSDLGSFRSRSRDVCRIEEGSTNAYLRESRIVEKFLREIEPRYNASLAKLREDSIDEECVYCIAGFATYIMTCSPAAMRIHSGPLRSMIETVGDMVDVPDAPEELGGKSLSELLADGTLEVSVDHKYPQALGIASLAHHISLFGNSRWEILHNDEADSQFFTSDYPAAFENEGSNTPIHHIIPLAPDLAIRIIPDIRLSDAKPDLSFSGFNAVQRRPKRSEIVRLNRLIVRCAEDLILYRDDRAWINAFVAKNRCYHVEIVPEKIPYRTGFLNLFTQRIVAREDK